MTRHYKKWTTQEETILKEMVKKHPNCLTTAYKKAGLQLGRTTIACKERWEKVCSKQKICFVLYGKTGIANRKNSKSNTEEQKPIIKFLKDVLNLFK